MSFVKQYFFYTLIFLTFIFSNTVTAQEKKLKVVTTFTVIADMVENVAGNHAVVESITKVGAEIHGYQPTPGDIIRAQDADLILWNGLNLELWFEQFFSNLKNVPSSTLTKNIIPISIEEGEYRGKPNPHAWMSLSGALIYIDNIEQALSSNDPKNKIFYEQNAKNYKKKIRETIAPLKQKILLVPKNKRWLVSCEGAFSYLIRDFEMQELYLWPINADAQGTPQQVRKVIDSVRKNAIPAVFCESTVSQSPAKQVARETKSSYGGMLYVDSLSKKNGPVPTFLDLLKVTSETIANGLNKK